MFLRFHEAREAACNICGKRSKDISASLGVCRQCILENWDESRSWAEKAHKESRDDFSLPITPPRDGKACGKCVNDCRIPEGEKGFCGVRANVDGKVIPLIEGAVVEWYYDPLPTNCVARFVCPECLDPRPRTKNLAVFYGACTFDCLFCQNWIYRNNTATLSPIMSAEELASKRDSKATCICYFGGDPTPQMDHALEVSRIALEKNDDTKICFETNGSMTKPALRKMADIAYESGGCIKFDLKTWHEEMNIALSGVSNKQTLSNFKWLSEYNQGRGDRDSPLLIASTLMVPGYVVADEVSLISEFLAEIDENMPYSLLAFHPSFRMTDMETTTRKQAVACEEAAEKSGLKRVNIGNIHLLH